MVNETDIVELELKSKRFNLSVKKQEALKAEQPVQVRTLRCVAQTACGAIRDLPCFRRRVVRQARGVVCVQRC